MTFWYLMVPMNTDDFIIWLLFALNFDQILKNRKNTLQKSIILTFHTDFALIPQHWSVWAIILHEVPQCHCLFLIFYWPTSKNGSKIYIFCLVVNLDQNTEKGEVSLQGSKFLKYFQSLVNKIWEKGNGTVLFHVKL